MKTKDRILAKALELFNQEGSARVTTNLIAKELSMSPGNLYYHFRNKEEIIQELYLAMVADFDATPMGLEERVCLSKEECLEILEGYLSRVIEVHLKYLFLARELVVLVNQDEELNLLFRRKQQQRLEEISGNLKILADMGHLKPLKEEEIHRLAEILWVMVIYWNHYVQLKSEEASPERIAEGVRNVHFLLAPYLA